MNDINHLLDTLHEGDPIAADQLLVLVYSELRRLAAAKMSREAPGQTLQPAALVHSASALPQPLKSQLRSFPYKCTNIRLEVT